MNTSNESDASDALLAQTTLEAEQRTSGFVYVDAPDAQAGQFVVVVKVGADEHRFRYTFQ